MDSQLQKLLTDDNVLCLYSYGSRVYGCATEKSDYDYIMIVDDTSYTTEHMAFNNTEINVYKKSQWAQMAQNCSVEFCECYFLPQEFKHKELYLPEFLIFKEKVRANFSKTASNSFVKCKKKLTVEKDFAPYIGKKSLWHSFRLLMFGIQILEHNAITDYSCANFLYDNIVNNDCNDWNYYKLNYQQLYNSYRSEFRKFDCF